MKKRKIALALAALTAAAVITAGCGGEKETANNDGKTTFTYWAMLPAPIATRVDSLNDVAMYQEREKETGIHIEFIHPAQGQESEQFNLMIASGDFPDMIEYDWAEYSGGAQKAIDDGVIIALNQYMDSKLPNFKKVLSENSSYDKGSKTDEGNYYAFPNFNTGSYKTFGGPLIRKDWLDELGLEIPKTIDDWTNVLTAFKEKKGIDTPFSAMKSYFDYTDGFNGAWGVGQRFYVDNGEVKFGPMEPGYKEYLAQMNKWYEAGLIDKDYGTNKRDVIDAKMTNDGAGATYFTIGGAQGVYLKQMEAKNPNYNLVAAPYPVLKEGDINEFCSYEQDVYQSFLAISTSCKEPEKAAEWMDFWYSDEGYKLLNFGVEGKTYNMVDGKPVYTDDILHNADNLSINEALSLHCRATQAAPGMRQAPEYLEQYYQYPQQIDSLKTWSKNTDAVKSHVLPACISPSNQDREEYYALSASVRTYVEEMNLKFITGAEPIENYDKFVENLKTKFNAERLLQIQQDMYDSYLAR